MRGITRKVKQITYSFLKTLNDSVKAIASVFGRFTGFIYTGICYLILREDPWEYERLNKILYLLIGINVFDMLIKDSKPLKHNRGLKKMIRTTMHFGTLLVLYMVLKKAYNTTGNLSNLKDSILYKITSQKSLASKGITTFQLLFLPIFAVNSLFSIVKEYSEFDEDEIERNYRNSETMRFNSEDYYEKINVVGPLVSQLFLLFRSQKKENFILAGMGLLTHLSTMVNTDIGSKKGDLFLNTVFRALVDVYIVLDSVFELSKSQGLAVNN